MARPLLSCQAPFRIFSLQLSENIPKIPAHNFADHFSLPAHTQTMSTNSKHGSRARRSTSTRPKPTRSNSPNFVPVISRTPISASSVETASFRRLGRRQNNQSSDFPLNEPKISSNSFVINKSIENFRRFFAIFLNFYARNGPFLPQNPPQRRPSFRFRPNMGSCFPPHQISELQPL